MKTASNVFCVIGMIANLIIDIMYMVAYGLVGLFIPLLVLSFIFGIAGLAAQEKSVGLGIALIFFVNPLSGIFHLCWDGK